jgi:hypothetical protein
MQVPITVNYTPDGDDWTVTVAVTGQDATRSAKAVGLIAARDQADQLVEQLAPDDDSRRVVHLLDGDAFAFTTSYLHARLGLTGPAEPPTPPQVATDRPSPDSPDVPSFVESSSTDQVINRKESPTPPWPGATVETTGNADPTKDPQ